MYVIQPTPVKMGPHVLMLMVTTDADVPLDTQERTVMEVCASFDYLLCSVLESSMSQVTVMSYKMIFGK